MMVEEDFEWLHKFLLETESLSEVSDDMREFSDGSLGWKFATTSSSVSQSAKALVPCLVT